MRLRRIARRIQNSLLVVEKLGYDETKSVVFPLDGRETCLPGPRHDHHILLSHQLVYGIVSRLGFFFGGGGIIFAMAMHGVMVLWSWGLVAPSTANINDEAPQSSQFGYGA